MFLTEQYKNRILQLAGILNELTDAERTVAFAASDARVSYNKDLMINAIKQGREIGILFKSDNEKYKMPISKYRIIWPVALGVSTAGNPVVRGYHVLGQSESAALETGKRSAETEKEWRLFKIRNIQRMWFTGNLFVPPSGFNPKDKSMSNIEVASNVNQIKKFQDKLKKEKEQETKDKKAKSIKLKPVIKSTIPSTNKKRFTI